jgi:Metallo-beta-lactamase superfamily
MITAGRQVPPPPTITPLLVADLLAEGERMPVYVHVIGHPDARVLVDTGMTEPHPAVADLDPRLVPLSEQDFDLAGIDIVVNTHLHFDHCGGNHLFAGRPIYVQRRELDDARSEDDYTFASGSRRPACGMCRSTASSSCCPGSDSSRRRATHAARRWSSSRLAGVRSSAATWRFGSASSASRTPKASCEYARSTPSWSGSRTSTSPGGRAPCKARRSAYGPR